MAKDRTNEAVEANEAQPTEATKRDEVQEQTVNEAEAIFERESKHSFVQRK